MAYTMGQLTGAFSHPRNEEFLMDFLEEATQQLGGQLMYCPHCGAIFKVRGVCPYCDARDGLESLEGELRTMALRLDQALLEQRLIKQAHYRTLYGPTPFYELEYHK